MSSRSAIIRADDEGEALWFNSDLFIFKATAEETDGAFTLFEESSQRGKRTPLHLHPHVDETFCVVEGEILVHVEGVDTIVGRGGVASVPRGVRHAVLVTSETARVLTFITPGSKELELFFKDAGEPAAHRGLPPNVPLPIDRIRAAAQKYGSVVLLGPPPFQATAAAS